MDTIILVKIEKHFFPYNMIVDNVSSSFVFLFKHILVDYVSL